MIAHGHLRLRILCSSGKSLALAYLCRSACMTWPDLSLACSICEHILQAYDRRTYRRFFGGLYLHLGKVEQDWNFPYGPKRHINSPTLQPGHDGPLALAGIC